MYSTPSSSPTFLDRRVDLVLGHIDAFGLVDRNTQARVEVDVAAAHLGRNGNFLGNLREGGTALLVLATFTVLDIGPLGMTSHAVSLNANNEEGEILLVRRLPVRAKWAPNLRYLTMR